MSFPHPLNWIPRFLLICLPFLLYPSAGQALMLMRQEFNVDFTKLQGTQGKATWSPVDKINLTTQGLGWEGERDQSHQGWIQVGPFPLGLSWRPTTSLVLKVEMTPPPQTILLKNGEKYFPRDGWIYARYSADGKHWSTWQLVPLEHPESLQPGRVFTANFVVPERDREEYLRYRDRFMKLDVPWTSDEEALCHWILKQDPRFFERSIPFIGYLEFLWEGRFYGGQRFASFHADASFTLGGIHTQPKNPAEHRYRQELPWRFKVP